MSRQDAYAVAVSIDGVSYGIWDKMAGGSVDSAETKYRAGALAGEMALGGARTVTNVTVSRLYDLSRDHVNVPAMLARVGKGTAVVTKQPLDVDGNAFGKPIVYQGILKMVNPPDVDSESSAVGLLEIEISTHASVG